MREFTTTYGKAILIETLVGLVAPLFLFLVTGVTDFIAIAPGIAAGSFMLASFFAFVSYVA